VIVVDPTLGFAEVPSHVRNSHQRLSQCGALPSPRRPVAVRWITKVDDFDPSWQPHLSDPG
jgi:hypothetical protein